MVWSGEKVAKHIGQIIDFHLTIYIFQDGRYIPDVHDVAHVCRVAAV